MKKGFTLIELLAVIVILAIIAAISTPIVLNIIDDIKNNSLKISLKTIEKAVNLYYHKSPLTENKIFECSNNKCEDDLGNKLNIKGKVPSSGSINISKSGHITYEGIVLDGYLCDKYNVEFVCNKTDKNIINTKEESIVINNLKDKLSNYKIYGNSVQDKNLIEYPYINANGHTENGITYTINKDRSITANGTATGDSYFRINRVTLEANKTYSISKAPNNSNNSTYQFLLNEVINVFDTDVDITLTEEKITTYYVLIKEGVTVENLTFYPIISEPTAPIKIESVGEYDEITGKYKIPVKVSGRNLIDYTKAVPRVSSQSVIIDKEINGVVWSGDYYFQIPVNIETGKTIVLTLESEYKYAWALKYEDNTNTTTHNIGKPFTTEKNVVSIFIYKSSPAVVGSNMFFKNILLEYDVEPITTNIHLDEPLRKVGNYVDYIDYKNKLLVKNVGILKLIGEENWEKDNDCYSLKLDSYPKLDKEISISNYLEYGKNFWYEKDKLKIKIDGINDIESLKDWLRNNNVEIYYPLEKSEISEIELPQIKLINNYSKINFETKVIPSNVLVEY